MGAQTPGVRVTKYYLVSYRGTGHHIAVTEHARLPACLVKLIFVDGNAVGRPDSPTLP